MAARKPKPNPKRKSKLKSKPTPAGSRRQSAPDDSDLLRRRRILAAVVEELAAREEDTFEDPTRYPAIVAVHRVAAKLMKEWDAELPEVDSATLESFTKEANEHLGNDKLTPEEFRAVALLMRGHAFHSLAPYWFEPGKKLNVW